MEAGTLLGLRGVPLKAIHFSGGRIDDGSLSFHRLPRFRDMSAGDGVAGPRGFPCAAGGSRPASKQHRHWPAASRGRGRRSAPPPPRMSVQVPRHPGNAVRNSQDLRGIQARCQDLIGQIDALHRNLPLGGPADADLLRQALGAPPDLVVRAVGQVHILYLATIVDQERLEAALIRPLITSAAGPAAARGGEALATFAAHLVHLTRRQEAIQALLDAKAVLLVRGQSGGFAAPIPHWLQRQPDEPPAEFVARGPHLGFVETLESNVALIRHCLRDPRLRWEPFPASWRGNTPGALLYLEELARPAMVRRVRRRLRQTRASVVTDSAMLAQWLAPRANILFPTIGTTERVDRAVAALLQGRVVLLVSGSPTALVIPNVFAHLLHVPDDYYRGVIPAFVNRLIRLFGLLVASAASPLLVALTTINHDLIPERLFVAIAQARRSVPLPIALEVLLLEVTVEVIREAGTRLPSPTGQSLSIIGAVIVGQAAVMSGLISSPAVVVVSLAFIASFVLPSTDLVMTLRFFRYPLILLAAVFGLYGVTWGLLLATVYLCSLDSFGVPYLAPLAPLRPRGLQDMLWRRPFPRMRRSFLARRAQEPGRAP
jgi:hypothetical protein